MILRASRNRQCFRYLRLFSAIFFVCFNTCCSQFPGMQRDDIFAKPRRFKWDRAFNKTRFTDEEKSRLLCLHNSYRSIVWPTATAMPELEWDNDLEDYAHNHVTACTGAHSQRSFTKKYTKDPRTWRTWAHFGENLYYRNGFGYSLEEAIWMFWQEGSKYDVSTGNCTHRNTCAHYKGIVNADSNYIGCAINVCKKFSKSSYPGPSVFLSCNYNGQVFSKGYWPGTTCKRCTKQDMGANNQYCRNRLCVSPKLLFTKTGFDGDISCIQVNIPSLAKPGAAAATKATAPKTPTKAPPEFAAKKSPTEEKSASTDPKSPTKEKSASNEPKSPTKEKSASNEPKSPAEEKSGSHKPTSPPKEKSASDAMEPMTSENKSSTRAVSKAPTLHLFRSHHFNILSFLALSMFVMKSL